MLLYEKLGLRPNEMFKIPGANAVAQFNTQGKLNIPHITDPAEAFELYQTLILNAEKIARNQCYKFVIELISLLRLDVQSFSFSYEYGYSSIYFNNDYCLDLPYNLNKSYPFEDIFEQGKIYEVESIRTYLES